MPLVLLQLLLLLIHHAEGHSRWSSPPPRSQSDGIKAGPCGATKEEGMGDFGVAGITKLEPGKPVSHCTLHSFAHAENPNPESPHYSTAKRSFHDPTLVPLTNHPLGCCPSSAFVRNARTPALLPSDRPSTPPRTFSPVLTRTSRNPPSLPPPHPYPTPRSSSTSSSGSSTRARRGGSPSERRTRTTSRPAFSSTTYRTATGARRTPKGRCTTI